MEGGIDCAVALERTSRQEHVKMSSHVGNGGDVRGDMGGGVSPSLGCKDLLRGKDGGEEECFGVHDRGCISFD